MKQSNPVWVPRAPAGCISSISRDLHNLRACSRTGFDQRLTGARITNALRAAVSAFNLSSLIIFNANKLVSPSLSYCPVENYDSELGGDF